MLSLVLHQLLEAPDLQDCFLPDPGFQICQRCLFTPSPAFCLKNQLAKEHPDSVTPVVIPAMAPTLDKSLRSDWSLCPIRALRYCPIGQNVRQNKELIFVHFKKGFNKDISPTTISSWIRQTVILCYALSKPRSPHLTSGQSPRCEGFCCFQGLSVRSLLGTNAVGLPLEVTQHLHTILPEGCGLV